MKTVLITGCSTGFGKLMADRFYAEGWTVIATLRNSARMQSKDRFYVVELDVTNEQDRQSAARFIEEKFQGKIDCLVNNAGYGFFGALEDSTEQEIRQQFEVNFFGLAMVTRTFLPHLRAAKGRVINLSSYLGTSGMPLTSLYCASKFAVEGLSESLRYELAPHGVQVGMVEPGAFRTSFGTNVNWSNGAKRSDSPYHLQSTNYQRFFDNMLTRKGNDPNKVVTAILKMAQASRMPLRVQVGKDARGGYLMRRMVPAFLWNRMTNVAYGAVFNKPLASTYKGN